MRAMTMTSSPAAALATRSMAGRGRGRNWRSGHELPGLQPSQRHRQRQDHHDRRGQLKISGNAGNDKIHIDLPDNYADWLITTLGGDMNLDGVIDTSDYGVSTG